MSDISVEEDLKAEFAMADFINNANHQASVHQLGMRFLKTLSAREIPWVRDVSRPTNIGLKQSRHENDPALGPTLRAVGHLGVSFRADQVLRSHSRKTTAQRRLPNSGSYPRQRTK